MRFKYTNEAKMNSEINAHMIVFSFFFVANLRGGLSRYSYAQGQKHENNIGSIYNVDGLSKTCKLTFFWGKTPTSKNNQFR